MAPREHGLKSHLFPGSDQSREIGCKLPIILAALKRFLEFVSIAQLNGEFFARRISFQ
jgi:hypothetical protein